MAKAAAPKKTKDSSPKRAKTKKDPNAPKRAMTAFFMYMQENRANIKQPGMTASEVAKAAGIEWGKLSDKSVWEKKAKDDKKRYERELAEYNNGQ